MNTAIQAPPALPKAITFAAALRGASSLFIVIAIDGGSYWLPCSKAQLRKSGAYDALRFGPPAPATGHGEGDYCFDGLGPGSGRMYWSYNGDVLQVMV